MINPFFNRDRQTWTSKVILFDIKADKCFCHLSTYLNNNLTSQCQQFAMNFKRFIWKLYQCESYFKCDINKSYKVARAISFVKYKNNEDINVYT